MLQNSQRIEFGGMGCWSFRTTRGRQQALTQAAEDAAQSDVDFEHLQHVMAVLLRDAESDVGDPDYLAAGDVDDLLIQ